ncbi:hypothetical protein FRB95_002471 [Tulasnella sp. JGI-2019a]|nr:hypothetical protein FRB95_002471 [Tulasnella sp. JGI-2019a]
MSSLPPQSVVLTEEASAVARVRLEESNPFEKRRLLYRNRYARPTQLNSTDQSSFSLNYTSLDALQTSTSYPLSSSTHYREAPETGNGTAGSPTFKDLIPLPEAFTQSHAYHLVEPFLLPLLFPIGCFTAVLHSISIVLPILPVAIFVGLAGSVLIPLVCIGGFSLASFVLLKGVLKAAEKQTRAIARVGIIALEAMDRVVNTRLTKDLMVMLGHLSGQGMDSDDGRIEKRPSPKRAALKPGPSILKPARPLQSYDDLPPSPLSATSVRPRSSFMSAISPNTKAKDVFKSRLLAEKEEKEKRSAVQSREAEMHALQVQAESGLPTPPDSDVSASPPFCALDIPPFTPSQSSVEEGADGEASPISSHYFASRHHSASTASVSSTASSSSYAPTPRTPGSPLVSAMHTPGSNPRPVKHVRIVDPMEEALRYYAVEDDDVEDLDDYAKPLREFAAAKLQDALGLLQTSAEQVWGSA